MWPRRSEILAPLTHLTSKDVPFQWTDVEQQAFDKMKAIVCCKVLLSYPDFNKPFHIHTDASHYQLHQSPGYFDHVLEKIVIIFKTYFENDQNILTSSSSMGFLPIKLMIIIILSFSIFSFIYFSMFV
jgi:hypothetical protein